MRKNLSCNWGLAIKTTISFLACFLVSVSIYAQEVKRVSIKEEGITIKNLLKLIEEKTGYTFAYDQGVIDLNALVAVNEIEQPVDIILENTVPGIDLKIDNKTIIILKENNNTAEATIIPVKGIVYDESDIPLIGVSVVDKSTGVCVITTETGEYEIDVRKGKTLEFSYLGYETVYIPVGVKSQIDVKLKSLTTELDQVVVIGYGVQKRSSVTGAIASVKAEDVSKSATTSVVHMLSGQVSGVQVSQSSAQPGGGVGITIRGAGSINAGNEPLYVIDGFPVNNSSVEPGSGDRYSMGSRSPLNSINPNDIQSIEILKDASATAIYGARAANGVVLITTKRGDEGQTKVDLSYSHSIQKMSPYFDVLNATEFMEMSNYLGEEYYRIQNNIYPYGSGDESLISGYTPKYTSDQIASAGEGTNWFDQVTRLGKVDDINISLSGGNAKTKFLISSNYYNQTGIVYNSDFKRLTGRVNLDHKINDIFKVGINMTGSYVDNGNTQLGSGVWENSGVLVSALAFNPLITVYDAYGNYSIDPKNGTLPNPVSYREIDDSTIQKRLLANAFLEVNPIKDLTIRVSAGVDENNALRKSYMPIDFLYGAQYEGKAYNAYSNRMDLMVNAVATYNKEINEDHNISIMAGYEYQQFNYEGVSAENNKFFTDVFGPNNLGAAEGEADVSSWKSKDLMASYFSRLNYSYKDLYVVNATIRYDGTSNFGENNKWGTFPSVAATWRINNENFMKSFDKLSNLKLRVSYGSTGNSSIGDGAFSYYGTDGSVIIGGNKVTSVAMTQLGNPNLCWETTTEFDTGIDYGFFNNRISGTIEYYNKVVNDILIWRDLPTYSNISSIADNAGATQLSGFEFNIDARIIEKEFRWNMKLNFATYENRWKERNSEVILAPYMGENDPIRAMYAYKTIGVAQIGQEVDYMPNLLPGNLIYEDVNGFDENNELTGAPDGKIDAADMQLIGSSDPGFTYGISSSFEYKGFDLSIFAYGFGNYYITNPNKFRYEMDAYRLPLSGINMMTSVKDIWTTENPSLDKPGMASNAYGTTRDYLIEKADFLRLKNITLGYTLPQKLVKGSNVRLYIDAQNLCVLSGYSGVDPETDGLGGYPNALSCTFGINVKF